MNSAILSRPACNALRGLAIIGIFLHNYCHWLGPIIKENEYQYFQHNVDWLNQVMVSMDLNLPVHLLSFFGHYGVPVFLFLSAYGLVMKYEAKPHLSTEQQTRMYSISGKKLTGSINWREPLHFIRYHYLKLFKMMIVGFVAFTMLDLITPGSHHYAALDIVAMLGMFNNVLPNPDNIIWPGPYWFFGLMLQLYIVYRLLLYRRHWGWTVGLMAICIVIQLLLGFDNPESEVMNRYRYNFMGGMLPFGLGILYARYGEKILMTFHSPITNFFGCIFCISLIYSLSGSMVGWTFVPFFFCLLSVLVADLLPEHQLVIRYLQGIRVDGQHLRRPLRMPPYHPQDIHPYQPSGRHLCWSAPLHHIEHLPGMALHPTDEEDSKPEILKENHEDKRYRTGEYQPVSRRVDGSSHAVHHPLSCGIA